MEAAVTQSGIGWGVTNWTRARPVSVRRTRVHEGRSLVIFTAALLLLGLSANALLGFALVASSLYFTFRFTYPFTSSFLGRNYLPPLCKPAASAPEIVGQSAEAVQWMYGSVYIRPIFRYFIFTVLSHGGGVRSGRGVCYVQWARQPGQRFLFDTIRFLPAAASRTDK
ncbi:hypothetical protein VTK73DRAFT_2166 [Phialemonium thermophilum]|uniref:Uncharacterized protein n=1 Tax=Phialemonium thermophilum TaxID=223376 RepID=A0ABR3X5V8_9PEZI